MFAVINHNYVTAMCVVNCMYVASSYFICCCIVIALSHQQCVELKLKVNQSIWVPY